MFEPFQQRDTSSRREFSGLGLGLTVARRLADFLGGSVQITSKPNVGTHVLLSLPNQLKAIRAGGLHPSQ
jgi:signal transduction histidine kinase